MAADNMSNEGFQTQFAAVMETVLKTAVTETTKLFETTIEELRAEISRIKEENDDLKSKLRSVENEKKSTGESESQTAEPGPSQRPTRNIGVQCVLTAQALPPNVEQHLHEVDQGTADGNPQMAFILIKQEVDWEADCSDEYSPGYILLKQEGGEPPTLVRRQPLRELPSRALVPPRVAGARINRYAQDKPPGARLAPAAALLQAHRDSPPRPRETTGGSGGRTQAGGAGEQSLPMPAVGHATPRPPSPASHQGPLPGQSASAKVQATSSVLSRIAGAPLQDPRPVPVPPRPPRPPRPPPAQSHTDVLPSTVPPARDLSGVATAAPMLPGHTPLATNPEFAGATPPAVCHISKTQFLAQLSVAPLVPTPTGVDGGEEGLSDAVVTRSVATETSPADEKQVAVGGCGTLKKRRREAILTGLRLRLRPRLRDAASTPAVAKKPGKEETSPLDHDYSKMRKKGRGKFSGPGSDDGDVKDIVRDAMTEDDYSRPGSSNQAVSEEEEGGANGDVARQSPIDEGGGVSKSRKRSMTWVQAQRGLALAQAKRSRSKVTKASQRGLRSELRGLVTQAQFLASALQRRPSHSSSPHAPASSPRRTSPRQPISPGVSPSPTTPPHPTPDPLGDPPTTPRPVRDPSTTPRRGRPRSSTAAVLNLTRVPAAPQSIPFAGGPRAALKMSPQSPLAQQAWRCRQSQPVWTPPGPFGPPRKCAVRNQCADCGRVLSSASALLSHASLHRGERPFACSTCGKDFPDLKGLTRHARVHADQPGHQCPQCGKTFVYRFGLTKHQQVVHSGVRPFVCQICDKRFVIRRDLETHLRVHTGERPFACSLCVKRFKRRVELNVHLRWHNGEKRHWCAYCGKGFLDYNNLKRHKLVHTGEKPYTCSECGKHFKQTGHLKKHLKNVHKVR